MVVLNISRTVPVAVPGVTSDGEEIELRLSSPGAPRNIAEHTWQTVFKPDSAIIRPGLRLSFGDGALTALVKRQREDIPNSGRFSSTQLTRPFHHGWKGWGALTTTTMCQSVGTWSITRGPTLLYPALARGPRRAGLHARGAGADATKGYCAGADHSAYRRK